MMTTLSVLLALVLIALVVVMLLGIGAMSSGGEFNRKYGNKMMRLRIALQLVAVAIIGAMFFFREGF
jgi:hypothetical protein